MTSTLPSPSAGQEREAFVQWLSTTYPTSFDEADAEHYWRHNHVSALAWQARATLSHPATQAGALQAVERLMGLADEYASAERSIECATGNSTSEGERYELESALVLALAASQPNAAPAAEVVAWRNRADPGSTLRVQPYRPDCPGDWEQTVYAVPVAAVDAREQEPEGWRLIKLATTDERSWPEDYAHENGHYFNTCYRCQRQFMGHKRRVECKACGQTPAPASRSEAPEARPNAAGQEQGEQS